MSNDKLATPADNQRARNKRIEAGMKVVEAHIEKAYKEMMVLDCRCEPQAKQLLKNLGNVKSEATTLARRENIYRFIEGEEK